VRWTTTPGSIHCGTSAHRTRQYTIGSSEGGDWVQDSDARIVRAVLSGYKDRFSELWDRYHAEAQRWAFGVTADFVEAEDIAQEAFTEALDRLESLREPERFGGWLRSIVRNRAVSSIRRRQRTVSIESVNVTADGTSSNEWYSVYELPRPDTVSERRHREQQLSLALEKLPTRYRQVVRLFYFEGESQELIARHVGCTVPAIKGILHRSRGLLRKELMRHERWQPVARCQDRATD
jgi:RNA polymerase sigma-70 factor, ECF subfamily